MKTKLHEDKPTSNAQQISALNVLNSIGMKYMETGLLDGMRLQLLKPGNSVNALYKINEKDVIIQTTITIDPQKTRDQSSTLPTLPTKGKNEFYFDVGIGYDASQFSILNSPYVFVWENITGSANSIGEKVSEAIEFAKEMESNSVLMVFLRTCNRRAHREAVESFMRDHN